MNIGENTEVLVSTVQKLIKHQVPDRELSKYEKDLAAFLQNLREKEGGEERKTITGAFTDISELKEIVNLDETKTLSNTLASALTLTALERLSKNHEPSASELEFITGKRERSPISHNGPKTTYTTHSSFSSGGSHYGICFEVRVKKSAIVITGFDANMSGSNGELKIWHREGMYIVTVYQSSDNYISP